MLEKQQLEEKLSKTRSGDQAAREELLDLCRPFVCRVAERFCGKKLLWGMDDELSIALIAFNEAIDRYYTERSSSFWAFAGMVIRSRLKDYRRKERKEVHYNLIGDGTEELNRHPVEIKRAWDDYCEKIADRERGIEIGEYNALLKKYGITFGELVKVAPKRRDYRQQLIRAAREVVVNQQLLKYLLKNKRLPLRELKAACGVCRKTLEKGRKYIIAIAILFYNRKQFPYLNSYLKIGDSG